MPCKPLSPFPDEVLLLVAAQLRTADLLNFLQVNSICHRVGVTALLKLHSTDIPLTAHSRTRGYYLNPCMLNPHYTEQLRSVTVKPHSHAFCRNAVLPPLPKLQVIRFLFTPEDHYERLLHEDVNFPQDAPRSWPEEDATEALCPLLDLHGVTTVVIAAATNLQAPALDEILPQKMYLSIQKAVLFLSPDQTGTGTIARNLRFHRDPTRIDWVISFAPLNVTSFTLVYQFPQPLPCSRLGIVKTQEEAFAKALLLCPRDLVYGILDLCDDIGYETDILEALPQLETFTIVMPDGVLDSEARSFLLAQIDHNLGRYRKRKIPTMRLLSMTELMNLEEYAGAMTNEEESVWRRRSKLPYYQATTKEIEQWTLWAAERREGYRPT